MNTDKIMAESIAKDYAPAPASKIAALKKLDKKAKQPALIFAWVFGSISCMLLGIGMSLAMHVIGPETFVMFGIGIIAGMLGIVGMCINYPVYKHILENGKQKYAFEIMELAKEIAGE